MSYADKIVAAAKSYVGQQEIQPNAGFKDPAFLAKMVARGWQKGQSWCAYLGKQCWVDAYADDAAKLAKVKALLNGSAVESLHNCKADAAFTVNLTPAPGALCVFQDGSTVHGHMAVCVGGGDPFPTIEGNSNSDGSANGYEVVAHSRHMAMINNTAGMHIIGFIHPLE